MSFKRTLVTAIALALTLPLLTVSAHPGRTDGSGGHTDTDTGDYHYHHGYEAHAHFDMDGNGTIDCPFDFDDQTGINSGASTGSNSYTPGDGSKDGYPEGYSDGFKKGKEIGFEDGYEDGKKDAEAKYKKLLKEKEAQYQEASRNSGSGLMWGALLAAAATIAAVYGSSQRRKSMEEELSNHSRAARSEINALSRSLEEQKTQLQAENAARIEWLMAAHAREIEALNSQLEKSKRFNALAKIAAGADPEIILPPDIRLKQSFTPIKGKITEHYPYGEYTVFLTPLGTTYHCKHTCAPSARPMHFFDLPGDIRPCGRCVRPDMYPQPRPDWHTQITQKLERVSTESSSHQLSLFDPNSAQS